MPSSFIDRLRAFTSDSLVLAAIPFIGSTVTLVYEIGYLDFYGVPAELISLDFVSIVLGISVVVPLFIFYLIPVYISGRFIWSENPILRVVALPTMLVLFTAPILILFGQSPVQWVALALLYVGVVAGKLVPPLFVRGNGGTYMLRLKRRLEADEEREEIERAVGRPRPIADLIFLAVLLAFALAAVREMGVSSAARQEVHLTVVGQHSKVIIRRYGDLLILKTFDRSTMRLGDEIRTAKLGEPEVVLLRERLGRFIRYSAPARTQG